MVELSVLRNSYVSGKVKFYRIKVLVQRKRQIAYKKVHKNNQKYILKRWVEHLLA